MNNKKRPRIEFDSQSIKTKKHRTQSKPNKLSLYLNLMKQYIPKEIKINLLFEDEYNFSDEKQYVDWMKQSIYKMQTDENILYFGLFYQLKKIQNLN